MKNITQNSRFFAPIKTSRCLAGLLTAMFMLMVTSGITAATDPWQDADDLRNARKLKEAVEAFSQLIRQNPENARAYKGRGRTFLLMNDFDAAIADFDRVIALDPKSSGGYNERGLAFQEKGLQERAILDFNRAIELAPNDGDAYKKRARILTQQGFYDQAIADCDKAIELNIRDTDAYFYRAGAYDCKGEDDKVLADYDKAVELDPKADVAHNNRGFFLVNRGDYDQAIVSFTKAIELKPQVGKYYSNRGNAWLAKGKMDKATADLNEAVRLDPKSARAFRNRAEMLLVQENFEQTIADATRSIELNPQEAKSYRIRSEAREAMGDSAGAEEDARQALILGPQPPLGMAVAVAPEIMAREQSALKAFLANNTPENRTQLAVVRHDHAFAILEDPETESNQAALEEAVAYAQSATELEPKNAGHWFLTGLLFRELSKKDERARVMAEQALRQAVGFDPEYAAGWLELGLMMMEDERGREAMTALEQSLDNDPMRTALAAVGPLTAMYAINDEGFRGLDFFQELYAANPEVPALGIGAAIMFDYLGDREAAMEQARDILLAAEPGTPEHDYATKLVAEWEGTKL